MGFYRNETGAYVTRENLLLVLIGYAAGIPLGFALHRFVMAQIEMDIVTYDVRIAWPSFFYALGFVLLFSFIVEFLQLWGFCDRFGITNEFLRIIIGTGFSWIDIACYCIGIIPCYLSEYLMRKGPSHS